MKGVLVAEGAAVKFGEVCHPQNLGGEAIHRFWRLLHNTVPFSFENANYEVRVWRHGEEYRIAAFHDGKRANGYEYAVTQNISFDAWQAKGISGLRHLIDVAREDVEKKRWEEVLEAVRQIENEKRKETQKTAPPAQG